MCWFDVKRPYLRMRVAPLRLMRHMEEQAMSYMIRVLQFFCAESNLGMQKQFIHDGRFGARAALFNAELVPHVAVAPLLHVDSNLHNNWWRTFKSSCGQLNQSATRETLDVGG